MHPPHKRSPSRRPLVPLPLSLMCRWLLLLNKGSSKESIVEWNFHLHSPMVTHLFFADDSLLFCKATDQECLKLIDILEIYEAVSRQKVNANKSFVFFSHNTPQERRSEVLGILGPMQDTRHN